MSSDIPLKSTHLFHIFDFLEHYLISDSNNCVHFSGSVSMTYPETDTKDLFYDRDRKSIAITLSFLSLRNVLYEYDKSFQQSYLECLFVIQNRIYDLLFDLWRKTELDAIKFNGNSEYYLSYISSFYQLPVGRLGLYRLLTFLIPDVFILIEESIHCWFDFPESMRPRLSRSGFLGRSFFVGHRFLDLSRKIVIHIGPITYSQYQYYFCCHDRYRGIIEVIRSHLDPWMTVDMDIVIDHTTVSPIRLNSKDYSLGTTARVSEPVSQFKSVYRMNVC